jgi:hypothetical protein
LRPKSVKLPRFVTGGGSRHFDLLELPTGEPNSRRAACGVFLATFR